MALGEAFLKKAVMCLGIREMKGICLSVFLIQDSKVLHDSKSRHIGNEEENSHRHPGSMYLQLVRKKGNNELDKSSK